MTIYASREHIDDEIIADYTDWVEIYIPRNNEFKESLETLESILDFSKLDKETISSIKDNLANKIFDNYLEDEYLYEVTADENGDFQPVA